MGISLEEASKCPLFFGLEEKEIRSALRCLGVVEGKLARDEVLFHEGDRAKVMGCVLSGALQIFRTDYAGNRVVIRAVRPYELFGEGYACAGLEKTPASAVAVRDTRLLLVDCKRVLEPCGHDCRLHQRLLENLVRSVAGKNLELNKKIFFMSRRTTREKLLAYLTDQAGQQGGGEFEIPFDRQALADYLGVERSAMSVELGKLKRDGILDFRGPRFRILRPEDADPGAALSSAPAR